MFKIQINFIDSSIESIIHEMVFTSKDEALTAAQMILAGGIGKRDSIVDPESAYTLYSPQMIKTVKILPQKLIL